MNAREWLMRAGPRRAAGPAGLAAFGLALPLAAILAPVAGEARWPALGLGSFYVGLFAALAGALRLRAASGAGPARLWSELGGAALIVGAIWVGASLAQLLGALGLLASDRDRWLEVLTLSASAPVFGGLSAAAAGGAYALCRGVALAWRVWDRLRRTRLLWALTHAQLVAGLLLAVGVAALLTANSAAAMLLRPAPGGEAVLAEPGPAGQLAWLVLRLLPAATALLVLSVAACVAVLPAVALISFSVLRRTTRRLEGLAVAAEALRAGNLAARAAVEGEDEVAQLEASFDAMAADLERTLRDLQAERDRVAGLLEANRQLVAAASHELRTPVANVRGYLESALGRGAAAGLREDLETMASEVGRLERLIDDLFSLSRAAVGRLELRPEPTDVAAVVRQRVETLAPIAWRQRRVQVMTEAESALPPALADGPRLEQLVSNLLANAVRHTPPGGLVVATVRAAADTVVVEVRDTGEGIAPEELRRVFERFYRGRGGDGQAGAGLGLALVKELAEAMGGSVAAASTPGEGSRFSISLPRA